MDEMCLFMYKTLWLPQVPYSVQIFTCRCESQVDKSFSVKVFDILTSKHFLIGFNVFM